MQVLARADDDHYSTLEVQGPNMLRILFQSYYIQSSFEFNHD